MGIQQVYTCDWCQEVIGDHAEQNGMQTVCLTTKPISTYTRYDNTTQHYEGLWCRKCLIETGLLWKTQRTASKANEEPTPPTIEDLIRVMIAEHVQKEDT